METQRKDIPWKALPREIVTHIFTQYTMNEMYTEW
jgi:hypothetical protein